MPAGRPTKYTPALAADICRRIAEGERAGKVLQHYGLNRSTLWEWLDKHPEFSDQYARAKEQQMAAMEEEILEIADDNSEDEIELEDSNGNPYTRVNHDHINRSRLRVDTRKWLMSKLAPKRYGDRIETEISGKLDLVSQVIVKRKEG